MTLVDRTPPYHPFPLAAEIIHRPPEELSGLDKMSHVAPLKIGDSGLGNNSGSADRGQSGSDARGGSAADSAGGSGHTGGGGGGGQSGRNASGGRSAASDGAAKQGVRSWGSQPATHKGRNGRNQGSSTRLSRANLPLTGQEDLPPWAETADSIMEVGDNTEIALKAINVLNGHIIHDTSSRVLNLALKYFPNATAILLSERMKTIIGVVETADEYGFGPDTLMGFGVQVAEHWRQIDSEFHSTDPRLIKAGKIVRKFATCLELAYWGMANTIEHDILFAASVGAILLGLPKYRSLAKARNSPSVQYIRNTRKIVDMEFNFVTDADNQWLLVKLTAHATEQRAHVLASKLSEKHNTFGEHSTLRRL